MIDSATRQEKKGSPKKGKKRFAALFAATGAKEEGEERRLSKQFGKLRLCL